MKFRWIRVPVIDQLSLSTVYEHTPLDPYRGEYPRFLRPVGAHAPRTEEMKVYEDGTIARPGQSYAEAKALAK